MEFFVVFFCKINDFVSTGKIKPALIIAQARPFQGIHWHNHIDMLNQHALEHWILAKWLQCNSCTKWNLCAGQCRIRG